MGRPVWTETRDGWQSGRYLIELAAPQLWVLSRRPKRDEGAPIDTWQVIRTAGSLRALERAAAELDRRRERRRGLIIHLVIILVMAGIAATAAMLDSALAIPAVIVVFAIALKTLVVWVETATGNAWSVLSEHYQ